MLFIFIVLLIGYLLSRVTLKSRALAMAFTPFIGCIVMASIGYLYRYQPPTGMAMLWGALGMLVLATVWVELKMEAVAMERGWEHLVFVGLGALLAFVCFNNQLCADGPTHAYVIKQIQLNNWPLRGFFPGDVTLKYHYGFDGVVAMLASSLRVEYVYVIKGLMWGVVLGLLYGVSYSLKARGASLEGRFAGLLAFFGFSGLSTFVCFTHWVSMLELVTVPSSLMLIGLTLWFVVYFQGTTVWNMKEVLVFTVVTVLVALGAPLYSSVTVALFLLVFGVAMLASLMRKGYRYIPVFFVALVGLIVFWKVTKLGMLKEDVHYEKISIMWVFHAFHSFDEYWAYIRVYAFFFLPIAVFALWWAYTRVKSPVSIWRSEVSEVFLFLGMMTCFIPFVLVFPYINMVDNYIKVPCIGMVCSLVLGIDIFEHKRYRVAQAIVMGLVLTSMYRLRLIHNMNRYILDNVLVTHGVDVNNAVFGVTLLLFVVSFCLYWWTMKYKWVYLIPACIIGFFFINVGVSRGKIRSSWNDQLAHYSERRCVHPNLLRWCGEHLDSTDMVFIPLEVNRDFCVEYSHHCTRLYSPHTEMNSFEEISSVAAVLLLNNANFSYAVEPELEKPLWDKFDDWYNKGNHTNVADFQAQYLIYPINQVPEYVEELIARHEIVEVAQDVQENWVIYGVTALL